MTRIKSFRVSSLWLNLVVFAEDGKRVYLELLREQSLRFGFRVQGYCLMANHVHKGVVRFDNIDVGVDDPSLTLYTYNNANELERKRRSRGGTGGRSMRSMARARAGRRGVADLSAGPGRGV